MSENTSFAFVANLLDVNCNLPFKVIEDCYLKKADSIQISQIKKSLLDSVYFYELYKFNLSPYELVYVEDLNTPNQKTQFFPNTSESAIWKKLYAYRSNIAHGSKPDFAKELLVLKDDSTAQNFLKLVVKMLLRHSLIEPQLYTDLKEC